MKSFFKKEELYFNLEMEFVKYVLFGFLGEQNRASGSVYHTPGSVYQHPVVN